MPDPFALRWKVDRPYVEAGKPDDVYALVTIEPNTAVLAQPGSKSLPVHILLLVDVSGSMDVLMRFDPNAQDVGEAFVEGRQSHHVVSEVPSRREMAGRVVQRLGERLQADDLLTIVAFDDDGYLLGREIAGGDTESLTEVLEQLNDVGGGGTHLAEGLKVIRAALGQTMDTGRTRKLVVLTDGEDDDCEQALDAARSLSQDFKLPIVAFGTGECKVSFLTEIAKTTLAGSFNHIRGENEAERFFHQVLTGQKCVQATNVSLTLWLSPDLQVRELYRTRPEILFVGDVEPDDRNQVVLRLEQMERGRAYEFLFRCTLPIRSANQRMRLAKATLSYDLPSLGKTNLTQECNVVVTYTADPDQANERNGDVLRVLSRAEVQRQVLFLQGKIDGRKQSGGTPRDAVIIANLLKALLTKFEQLGDQAMVNQYRSMQKEFTVSGDISQEMLNRSLAASSMAEELIAAQDIDF